MPTESVITSNLVNEAVKEVEKALETSSGGTKENEAPAKETPKGDEKKESDKATPNSNEEVKETEPLSEEELNNAKTLYKALKAGGESAGAVIDALATRNGYQKIETKKEAKEAKVEIKSELEEALGEDYPDLLKKLAPAIDKYVDRKLKESTEDIRTTFQQESQAKLESRSEATFAEISKEYYEGKGVPKEVDESMAKLMERYKPEPNQEIEEYIKDMFHLASSKVGKPPASKAVKAATTAAKNNVPAKLDSSSGRPIPAETTNVRTSSVSSKAMTLEQAVRSAIQQIENDSKN